MLNTLIALVTVIAPINVQVHVDGDGFMRFAREGRVVYSKKTSLTVTNGVLASTDGPTVNPRISVAEIPDDLRVDLDGTVSGIYQGSERKLGKLVIALFPEDVRPVADRGFLVSSYRPDIADPGTGLAGVVRMGRPEGSATVTVVAPAVASSTVEVRLLDIAQVEGKSFTLGEIASVAADEATKRRLESIEVGTTPAFGATLKLSPEMVRLRILRFEKQAESYTFSGPSQVEVSRKGQAVTPAMFESAALDAVKKQLGSDSPLVCESNGPTITVALGKLELVGENIQENGSKYLVRVAILVDGVRINSRTVTVAKNDALSKMTVGMTVKVIVRANGAIVETSGKIRSIDKSNETVIVESETGAELMGRAVAPGVIEVVL